MFFKKFAATHHMMIIWIGYYCDQQGINKVFIIQRNCQRNRTEITILEIVVLGEVGHIKHKMDQ